jgi:Na+-driven multidrug efflux pump
MQFPMKASWAGVAMTIGLDILLIPVIGIIGAAWATTIAYATTSVYLVYMAQKKLGFRLAHILLLRKSDITWLLSRKAKNPDLQP